MSFYIKTFLTPLQEEIKTIYLNGYGDVSEESYIYQEYLKWLEEGNTPEEWNPDIINDGDE